MAVTATLVAPPGSIKSWDTEIHTIVWTSTTATVEVTTGLSEIYAAVPVSMYGTNAAHVDGSGGILEIDEASVAGVITPAAGAITVNRFEQDSAVVLTGQSTLLLLFGKS